jgi:AraC family transcriptional activator of tynA and feaB
MHVNEISQLRLASKDPERHSGEWEDAVSASHVPMSVRISPHAARDRFFGRIQHRPLDDLSLVDYVSGPCTGSRGRGRISATDDDHVGVLITRSGREILSFGGTERVLLPGTILTWDTQSVLRIEIPENYAKRSLIVPRSALAEIPAGRSFVPGLFLDRTNPAVRMLVSHLESVWRLLPQLSGGTLTAARRATLDLLGAVVDTPSRHDLPAEALLRETVQRWIDRQLPLGTVTPQAAAMAHGVSVRTLHRSFAAGGSSFGAYVRLRRLACARDELSGPQALIGSVARRWGYADASHFGRVFRAQYGASPSDYRGSITERRAG